MSSKIGDLFSKFCANCKYESTERFIFVGIVCVAKYEIPEFVAARRYPEVWFCDKCSGKLVSTV